MSSLNPFSSTFNIQPTKAELLKQTVIPSANLRVHGITIYRPIIYGNITYKLPKAPEKTVPSTRGSQDENQDWYRWTVYVRGVENEDLSYFIKKVVFYIHDSFTAPVRVIEKAPFELTEIGWGQFEIKIDIFFHDIAGLKQLSPLSVKQSSRKKRKRNDSNHKLNHNHNGHHKNPKKRTFKDMIGGEEDDKGSQNKKVISLDKMMKNKENEINELIPFCYNEHNDNKVSVIHALRLFEKIDSDEDATKGILEEKYTEIVFKDPYYSLYEKLILGPHKLISTKHPFMKHWESKIMNIAQTEQDLIQKMSRSHEELLKEMESARMKYQNLCQTITTHKNSSSSKN